MTCGSLPGRCRGWVLSPQVRMSRTGMPALGCQGVSRCPARSGCPARRGSLLPQTDHPWHGGRKLGSQGKPGAQRKPGSQGKPGAQRKPGSQGKPGAQRKPGSQRMPRMGARLAMPSLLAHGDPNTNPMTSTECPPSSLHSYLVWACERLQVNHRVHVK